MRRSSFEGSRRLRSGRGGGSVTSTSERSNCSSPKLRERRSSVSVWTAKSSESERRRCGRGQRWRERRLESCEGVSSSSGGGAASGGGESSEREERSSRSPAQAAKGTGEGWRREERSEEEEEGEEEKEGKERRREERRWRSCAIARRVREESVAAGLQREGGQSDAHGGRSEAEELEREGGREGDGAVGLEGDALRVQVDAGGVVGGSPREEDGA